MADALLRTRTGAVAARSRPAAEAAPILAEQPRLLLPSVGHGHDARRTYTIEEANALIPQVRAVLLQLAVEQRRLDAAHAEMHRQLDGNGDPGAPAEPAAWRRETADIRRGCATCSSTSTRSAWSLRDLEMGLVDFPGERDGEPVWLCWRLADPASPTGTPPIEGYATRQPW